MKLLNRVTAKLFCCVCILTVCCTISVTAQTVRSTADFTQGWKFNLGDVPEAKETSFADAAWRSLNLPHDWSIEGKFDEHSKATTGGGALPGGIGWYRKTFTLPAASKSNNVFIDFDGVYLNSEVWINGHYLGIRPYGFSSFRYNLTPWLKFGNEKNVVAVKVDNSQQPNSRWYSGSGIYRNVWLVQTGNVFVDHWGTYITTPVVSNKSATAIIKTTLANTFDSKTPVSITTVLYNAAGIAVATKTIKNLEVDTASTAIEQSFTITNPQLWNIEKPYLYKAITSISISGKKLDDYTTSFGIRTFVFDADKGFLLNGKSVKINGVCDHHDLGSLGAAINTRALERQLEILKAMGCNGIRTSHNPPAPELLDLCDRMGFIVMDEAFDMWKKQKNPYDYHLHWDDWHRKDLEDMVLRDRNHPSVFIWSIGNEIPEQWGGKNGEDSSGILIGRELGAIVKNLDTTRPVTAALNDPFPNNNIYKSGALDLVGFNYHHQNYIDFHKSFPGKKFIGTETVSALETRGHYDMPSDSIRRWPVAWDKPFTTGNADLTVSAYDNVSAPWGSLHEETWKLIKKYDYLAGQYIWTGFDYLGEPTPYPWPAHSSYFGIIDLAGFPKDVYYMYQSEWTDKPVLHIFPHWNWKPGQLVDVWAYYNHADEVELFLNGKSLGVKKKQGDDLHVFWRVPFEPGTIKAVSRKDGKIVLVKEIKTAGKASKIILTADRSRIKADGKDLSFVTAKIEDAEGNLVPDAANHIEFAVTGTGFLAGVDSGNPTDLESFKASGRNALNGLCLAVVQSKNKAGVIQIKATAEGLQPAVLQVLVK